MRIDKCFNKLLDNILLTSAQREDARTKYNGVCKKLHDHYYPDKVYDGSTKLLVGSFGKDTTIRPPRDVDVLFTMPAEEFDKYNDHDSSGQSQLLQDIRIILKETYSTTESIKAWGKVVVIEFSEGCHNVELLPAWENSDGTFKIADTADGGAWKTFDPREEINSIKQSNDVTIGRTKALIRMVKKWAEGCSVKIRSYEIENNITDYLQSSDFNRSYQILLSEIFGYLFWVVSDENQSYVQTVMNRIEKAILFEDADDPDNAIKEWKKIFGDDFPSIELENRNATIPIVALNTPAHEQKMLLFFKEKYFVRIDAYTYTNDKKFKLRGINSNSGKLAKELSLKYIAKTNAPKSCEYHWQVVNTGKEASDVGQLRGHILKRASSIWENTLYTGTHWVRCYLIENGIYVGKSSKFFINIK